MSDNWITIIPTQPDYLPKQSAVAEAENLLNKNYRSDEPIVAKIAGSAVFHHPIANLESVSCPNCGGDLTDYFFNESDVDETGELENTQVKPPCCGTMLWLSDLDFEMPAGFSRFAIALMNPGVSEIAPHHMADLKAILGSPLKQVFTHI